MAAEAGAAPISGVTAPDPADWIAHPIATLLLTAAERVRTMQEEMLRGECPMAASAAMGECVMGEPVAHRRRSQVTDRAFGSCGCRYTARWMYSVGILNEDPWSAPEFAGQVRKISDGIFPRDGSTFLRKLTDSGLIIYGSTPPTDARHIRELRETGVTTMDGWVLGDELTPGLSLVQLVYRRNSRDSIQGELLHTFVIYVAKEQSLLFSAWYSEGEAAVPMQVTQVDTELLRAFMRAPCAEGNAEIFERLFGSDLLPDWVGNCQAVAIPAGYAEAVLADRRARAHPIGRQRSTSRTLKGRKPNPYAKGGRKHTQRRRRGRGRGRGRGLVRGRSRRTRGRTHRGRSRCTRKLTQR